MVVTVTSAGQGSWGIDFLYYWVLNHNHWESLFEQVCFQSLIGKIKKYLEHHCEGN